MFTSLVEDLNEDDTSSHILSCFYNGLKQEIKPHYRMSILNNPPKNLSHAYTIAQAAESALEEGPDAKKTKPDSSKNKDTKKKDDKGKDKSKDAPNTSPSRSSLKCNYCGRLGHLENQCRTKVFDAERIHKSIICHICQQPGHIAPNCPSKVKNSDPAPSQKKLFEDKKIPQLKLPKSKIPRKMMQRSLPMMLLTQTVKSSTCGSMTSLQTRYICAMHIWSLQHKQMRSEPKFLSTIKLFQLLWTQVVHTASWICNLQST